MMFLIGMMMLVTVSAASAQMVGRTPTQTVNIKNEAGEKIGTAYVTGNMMVLRDRHGTHYATVIKGPDGEKWFDANGQPTDPNKPLPLE